MSTIKNRVLVALAGHQLTAARIADLADVTPDQAITAIKHLRDTADVATVTPGVHAVYELTAKGQTRAAGVEPLRNVPMAHRALLHSPVSVFAMGARA